MPFRAQVNNEAIGTDMGTQSDNSDAEDIRHRRDHDHWRAEHAEALAILRSAEAKIIAHEAQIMAHEANMGEHRSVTASDSADGGASAETDAAFARQHDAAAPHHHDLRRAKRALEPLLDVEPQP